MAGLRVVVTQAHTRILSTLQGEKFDKEGEYVKDVPELKIYQKFVHKPWEFRDKILFRRDYPYPIVKHEQDKALDAFKKI